ncbi:PREDICTED: Down syndrome cell adhesion molecule-like protein Dscam2 [Acropora digitifera]|uniref:Down syndrome cell adhesion molecule-like protein Dscam2 n=1 Tax=Acropora digitifera TaxID=70779 RepID=UPI00077AE008|nr:PREDICTED: Down syndrome cell adhesion molecule-like protein Dscam2 [Acropora digitifera]
MATLDWSDVFNAVDINKVVKHTCENLSVFFAVPTSFNVTPLTPTSVRASWEFTSWDSLPLGVVIRGLKLLYRLRNSSNLFGTTIVWGNSTFSKNISGLEKYAEYEFKVLAFTANGDGPSSSVLVVRTDEDVPSLAPANFIVASQTSTSILASWQPPPIHSRNGIIIGFKLFYKRKGSSNSGYTVYIHDALTYNATGLLKYTEYELQVLAFTKIGDGRNSSVLTTRTRQDVPSQAPVNLRVVSKTSTSIMVSWQPPPLDSRNGIIIGFKLFYKRKIPLIWDIQ